MGMWENLGQSIVYFIPTYKFWKTIVSGIDFPEEYMEWYIEENKKLFIYFNSWEELSDLIKITNYTFHKNYLTEFMKNHREKVFKQWKDFYSKLNFL